MNMNYRPRQASNTNASALSSANEQPNPGIIAAIPCFNEERFIGSVVLKAKNYVDQVMVIDDGSTDNTAMVSEQAGAMVVRHESNRGKGAAVSTAFELAREMECRALVILDGDGLHEPADIPLLLKPVLDGQADMVVGSRFLQSKSQIPRYRVWGQHLLTFLTNLGSQVKLTDSQSGFRAFSLKAIRALSFAEKGLSVESEMQFLLKKADIRAVDVPVSTGYYGKAERNPIAHGMVVLNGILRLINRRRPLLFFGVPGLIMLALGLWQGWRVVQGYESTGEFFVGPAMITILLCILGTLSLFTGLILHSITSLRE